MSHLVLLSRDLPVPPISAGGMPVTFQTLQAGQDIPGEAKVYCTTALDSVDSALIRRLPESAGLIANLGVGKEKK